MVVVWSANHFYYNGELFSCLLYSSLEAIFLPPAKQGVNFGQPKMTNPTVLPVGFVADYLQISILCTILLKSRSAS